MEILPSYSNMLTYCLLKSHNFPFVPNEKFMVLGISIFRHIRVYNSKYDVSNKCWWNNKQYQTQIRLEESDLGLIQVFWEWSLFHKNGKFWGYLGMKIPGVGKVLNFRKNSI